MTVILRLGNCVYRGSHPRNDGSVAALKRSAVLRRRRQHLGTTSWYKPRRVRGRDDIAKRALDKRFNSRQGSTCNTPEQSGTHTHTRTHAVESRLV
eukprot:1203939-Pyramimonas_sp.AAC.2